MWHCTCPCPAITEPQFCNRACSSAPRASYRRVSARHWVFPKGVVQREYQLACIQVWAGCLVAVHAGQYSLNSCTQQQCAQGHSQPAAANASRPASLHTPHPTPQTALLTNTLVCLPTGLGKTLIAAVVMHNFARWFPEVRWLAVFTSLLCVQMLYECLPRLSWPSNRAAHVPITDLTP